MVEQSGHSVYSCIAVYLLVAIERHVFSEEERNEHESEDYESCEYEE